VQIVIPRVNNHECSAACYDGSLNPLLGKVEQKVDEKVDEKVEQKVDEKMDEKVEQNVSCFAEEKYSILHYKSQ
jgi:predicted oxidoreductase (fatty acid repression mutant protein)